jgi:hypothetical protein
MFGLAKAFEALNRPKKRNVLPFRESLPDFPLTPVPQIKELR